MAVPLYKHQRVGILSVFEQLFDSLPPEDRKMLDALVREVGISYGCSALRGKLTSNASYADYVLAQRKMKQAAKLNAQTEKQHANQVGS